MASIVDFGAKGDGQRDDTLAMQHAIEKGDGVVVLPRGEYRLTRPVAVPLDKWGRLSIQGDGTAKVIMAGAGPAFHLVGTHTQTALPTQFQEGVWLKERMPHLSDFEIVGAHPQADAIRIEGVMQPTLRGLLIRKCRHGIHLVKRNRNVLIADCHIYDNSGVGVYLDAVNLHQININSNHISYCQRAGILVEKGEVRNIQIVGNDIEYNYADMAEDCADVYFDAREGTIREGTIVGCTIQAKQSPNGANVRIRGGGDTPNNVGMLSITGNLIGSQATALHLESCRAISIAGNSIYSGYQNAIVAEKCEALSFSGNTIDHNPDYQGSSTDAVIFRACQNLVISGLMMQHTRAPLQPVDASMLFDQCEQVTYTGGQIIHARMRGMLLRACQRMIISGSLIRGQKGDATYRTPIETQGKCRDLLISSNLLQSGNVGEWKLPMEHGESTSNRLQREME